MSIIAEIQSKGLDKLAEDFKKSAQAGKELNSELQTASSNTNSLTDNLNKMKQQLAGLQTGSKEFKELEGEIKAAEAAMNSMYKNSETLKREYRELIKEVGLFDKALNDLERTGNKNTQVYRDLKQAQQELKAKAGELKYQIGDLQAEISTLGSDTRGLDLTLRGLTALSGGFQAVQGASVLFGKENKKLEETLVKLNAVMSITQGLQVIQEELSKKDSLITLALGRAKQFLALAIGQGSTAMKIFRGALLATGIGAAIVGIIALYENWEKIKDAISGATDAMREQQRISKLNSEVHKEATEGIKSEVARLYELLAVAKNENLSKKERQDAINQINQNYPEYLKNISLENINTEKANDLIRSQIKLMSLREEVKKLIDKRAGLNLAKENEDELKKQLGFFEKIDLYLYGDLGKTKDEYYNKAKKRIDAQITDIDTLIKQKMDEIGSSGATTGLVETTKDKVTKSVSESVSYLVDEWKKRLTEIEKQIQEMIAKSVLTGKDVDNNIFKKLTDDAERFKNMIAEVEKQIDFYKLKIELPSPEKISEDLNNSIPKPKLPFEAVIDNVTIPEDVGEGDLIPPTTKQKFQYEMSKLFNIDLSDPQFKLKLSENLISTAQQISSGIFQLSKDASDARLAILEDEKNRGIITEKQYQEEVRKEKIKQAKQAKAEAIFNIGINIAQAITKAIAQGGIAGIAIGAIMSAIGLAQLAIVASKPLPAFKKGVIDLPLGNNPKGDDTIPAMLHEGESVMTAEETKKHKSLFKAIRGNKYDDWVNEEFYKMIKEVGVRPSIFDIKLPQFGGTSKVKSKDVVVNVNNDKIVEELYWIRHAVDKMDRNNSILMLENNKLLSSNIEKNV